MHNVTIQRNSFGKVTGLKTLTYGSGDFVDYEVTDYETEWEWHYDADIGGSDGWEAFCIIENAVAYDEDGEEHNLSRDDLITIFGAQAVRASEEALAEQAMHDR